MSYSGAFPYGSGHQQSLDSSCVSLSVRQQPVQALVTTEGKEKSRKPIDPPPIVQIEVRPDVDPYKHYLVSPYFFMYATLLPHDPNNPSNEVNEHDEQTEKPTASMLGQLCSSLHRLKDVDNQDGGFFIFGDLSVRKTGWHKLRFALYDVSKAAENAAFIKDVVSEPFQVVPAKDFHGMEESSYLSRAFSDQGVRLRLRKEPRSISAAHRRGHSKYSPPQALTPQRPQVAYAQTQQSDRYGDSTRPHKRQRSESDYNDTPNLFPPSQMPRTSYSNYGGSSVQQQNYGQYKPDPQERMPLGYSDYNMRGSAYQPPLSNIGGYQNPIQQPGPSPLSNNNTMGNIGEHGPPGASSVPRPLSNYYGSTTASGQNYGSYSGNYQSHHSTSYAPPARSSSESYPSILGLQTPTSMTDIAALPSGPDQTYMPSTSGPIGTNTASTSHTPVHAQHHSHDYSGLSGSYTHAPATYVDSSPTYQSAPPQQPHHTPHNSLGGGSQTGAYGSSLPPAASSVPQSNMLLGESMPQNFYHQSEETGYPTPTHVKQAQPPWG